MKNKYAYESSEKGRFFFGKPEGPGLSGKEIVQKFAKQKAMEDINQLILLLP